MRINFLRARHIIQMSNELTKQCNLNRAHNIQLFITGRDSRLAPFSNHSVELNAAAVFDRINIYIYI